MKFWDTSALVPLIVHQPASRGCRALWRADPRAVVWALTRVETVSALCRLRREKILAETTLARALSSLDRLSAQWSEVDAVDEARRQAERLLRSYPLSAADALQLGAALVVFAHSRRQGAFVCLDERLATAAAHEGLDVVRPTGAG